MSAARKPRTVKSHADSAAKIDAASVSENVNAAGSTAGAADNGSGAGERTHARVTRSSIRETVRTASNASRVAGSVDADSRDDSVLPVPPAPAAADAAKNKDSAADGANNVTGAELAESTGGHGDTSDNAHAVNTGEIPVVGGKNKKKNRKTGKGNNAGSGDNGSAGSKGKGKYDAGITDVTRVSWVSMKSMTVVSFILGLFLNIVLFIVGWIGITLMDKAGLLETINGLLGSMMTIDPGSMVKMLALVCVVLTVVFTLFGVLFTLLFNAASLIVGGINVQTRTFHMGERVTPCVHGGDE